MSHQLFERIRLILKSHLQTSFAELAVLLRDGDLSASELQLRAVLDECKTALGLLLVKQHHFAKQQAELSSEIIRLGQLAKQQLAAGNEELTRQTLARQWELEQLIQPQDPLLESEITSISETITLIQQKLNGDASMTAQAQLDELNQLAKDAALAQKMAALRKEKS